MRNFFLTSDSTPSEFVLEKGLPEEALTIIEKDQWDVLRDAFRQEHSGDYKTLAAVVADGALRVEMEVHALQLSMVQDQVNFLKDYLSQHGDLCARHTDGRIMKGLMGQPMMLHVPASPGEILSRKGQAELILNYMKVLENIDHVHQRLTGQVVEIQLDNPRKEIKFMHLLEPKKDEQ